MPGTIDLIVAGLIAVAYPIFDYFVLWPHMQRVLASSRPDGRVIVFRDVIVVEWVLVAIVAGVWIRAARPWRLLGLAPVFGWPLVLSIALVAALLMFFRAQLLTIRRLDPARRDRIRAHEAVASAMIPRNGAERAWFGALSLTAGLCEEFLHRGFLIWALRPWLGLWGAALSSTLSFGLAHAYLGRRGVLRAGAVGAVFAVLAIVLGSIVPGMALHALLDLISGEAGHALFAEKARA